MATSRTRGNQITASRTEIELRALQQVGYTVLALFVALYTPLAARAQQSGFAPIAITPPAVDFIDENFVSMISGKVQFTIPALKMGDVSFTAMSANGPYFQAGGAVEDENYGGVVACENPYGTNFAGVFQCAAAESPVVQASYGLEHDSFYLTNGAYTPYVVGGNGGDGSTFVDNVAVNGTCTWTQRDGTRIVYYGFHASGSTQICQANNIYQIIHPDGRIATYYYYGNPSTPQPLTPNALLSIATNDGYLLKYNYSGTPTFGGESSVVAINRAFET